MTGTLTLTDGAINTGTVEAQGNITQEATFDGGSTLLIINGAAAQLFTGNAAVGAGDLPDLEINKATGTLTLTGIIRINGNGTGAWTYTAGTIAPGTSTVVFAGDNTISGSHTLNNLTIESGTQTIAAGTTITVTGTLTLTNGNINQATIPAAGTIALTGTLAHQAGFDGGTGLIIITTAGVNTFNLAAGGELPALTLDATDVTINGAAGNVTFDGALTITNGTFNSGDSLTLSNALTVSGTANFTAPATLIAGGANNVTWDIPADITVTNFQITKGGNTLTLVNNRTINVTGTLTLTDGNINQTTIPAAGTIALTGNNLVHGAGFDGGTGLIVITTPVVSTFNLTAGGQLPAVTLDAATVTINGPGGAGNVQFDGTLTIENGIFNGANQITLNSGLTISGGTFTAPTTLVATGNSATWDVLTTVNLTNLTVNKAGGQSLIVATGDTLVVTGTLTLTNGNIDTGTVEAQGNVTHAAGFDGGTGLLKITGAAVRTINLTGGGELPSVELDALNVTMNGSATGTVTIMGSLTLHSGTFTGAAGNFTINNSLTQDGGNFTAPSATLTVAGDWARTGGIFNANSGTVVFNNAGLTSAISGSTTFNNFTCATAGKQFTFTAGSTQTINGTLTFTGAAGNLIILRSSIAGTQWKIDPFATNISYVDVQDSDNINPTIITAANSTNSGNNINWFFGSYYLSISSSLSQDAGSANQLTIKALFGNGTVLVSYNGNKQLTFSGAGSFLGSSPTVTDNNGNRIAFGLSTTIAFTNGISSAGGNMVLYLAGNNSITASDGIADTNTPLVVQVKATNSVYEAMVEKATTNESTMIKFNEVFMEYNFWRMANFTVKIYLDKSLGAEQGFDKELLYDESSRQKKRAFPSRHLLQ